MTIRLFFISVMIFLFAIPNTIFGQADVITLTNPSFEDYPRAERVPHGWRDCGFAGETPPDTHPSGTFDVVKPPNDGNTYLGMVVRDNDTWERVSQQLSSPIQRGTCYSFSLNLCRSELYMSRSKRTHGPANYVDPIKLVIWGGDGHCSKKELLAESPLIGNTNWEPFAFKFEPKQTHTYITFEAFYKTPVLFPYNGNILVDNASEIAPMPCDEELILARMPEVEVTNIGKGRPQTINTDRFTVAAMVTNIDKKSDIKFKLNGRPSSDFTFNPRTGEVSAKARRLKTGKNVIIIEATNKAGTIADGAVLVYEPPLVAYEEPPAQPQVYEALVESPIVIPTPPKEAKKLKNFSGYEITEGQIIPFNAITFGVNDTTLNKIAHAQLDELHDYLIEYKKVTIEIGGHTSGLCKEASCNYLSTVRARQVAVYLQNKGVPKKQLVYKGYGKSKPIASNKTIIGRETNRRIEIKILSTDG